MMRLANESQLRIQASRTRRRTGALLGAGALLAGLWSGPALAQQTPPMTMPPVMPSRVLVNANAAQVFVTEARRTEGITANPRNGDLFVGTTVAGMPNVVLRFDRDGQFTGSLDVGTGPVLGLAFNPKDGKVYFAQPANGMQPSRIVRVSANFGSNSQPEVVAQVPLAAPLAGSTPPAMPIMNGTPNGLVFRDSNGDLLFSDSAQSIVFRIVDPSVAGNTCPTADTCVSIFARDPLIVGQGAPPVGTNGLAFSSDETKLFVANTGNDQLIAFNVTATGVMGPGAIFVQDINGADGLIQGPAGTLVVTANRADQVVILDEKTGRVLAELGEFLGVDATGRPIGLSTPASVTRVGDALFVTNLSAPSADGMASPEADVRLFTISRIQIPAPLLAATSGPGAPRNPLIPMPLAPTAPTAP